MEHYQIKIESIDYGPSAECQEHKTGGLKIETEDIPLEFRQANSLNRSPSFILAEIDCSQISVAATPCAAEQTPPKKKTISAGLSIDANLTDNQSINPLNREAHPAPNGRPFPCSKCPRSFFTKRGLGRHMTIHNPMKPPLVKRKKNRTPCQICGLKPTKVSMKAHMIRHVQSDERSVACPVCPQTWFPEELTMKAHLYKMHGLKYATEITDKPSASCESSASTVKPQLPAKKQADPEKQFVACPYCCNPQIWFAKTSDLAAHLTQTHVTTVEAEKTTSAKEDISPMELNSVEEPLVDAIIDPVIKRVEAVTAPEKTLTKAAKAPYRASKRSYQKCNICGMLTPIMKYHMIRHNINDAHSVVPCPICPQTWFANTNALNKHMHNGHGKKSKTQGSASQSQRYFRTCNICGLQTPGIKYHMIRHNMNDARSIVPCPICPQTWFADQTSLNKHMKGGHGIDHKRDSTTLNGAQIEEPGVSMTSEGSKMAEAGLYDYLVVSKTRDTLEEAHQNEHNGAVFEIEKHMKTEPIQN